MLTGLGIGGIAVALAAQSTLENFIGSITLYLDPPVRVGEFCSFGDKEGTVEHIGWRATRIRTCIKGSDPFYSFYFLIYNYFTNSAG